MHSVILPDARVGRLLEPESELRQGLLGCGAEIRTTYDRRYLTTNGHG